MRLFSGAGPLHDLRSAVRAETREGLYREEVDCTAAAWLGTATPIGADRHCTRCGHIGCSEYCRADRRGPRASVQRPTDRCDGPGLLRSGTEPGAVLREPDLLRSVPREREPGWSSRCWWWHRSVGDDQRHHDGLQHHRRGRPRRPVPRLLPSRRRRRPERPAQGRRDGGRRRSARRTLRTALLQPVGLHRRRPRERRLLRHANVD